MSVRSVPGKRLTAKPRFRARVAKSCQLRLNMRVNFPPKEYGMGHYGATASGIYVKMSRLWQPDRNRPGSGVRESGASVSNTRSRHLLSGSETQPGQNTPGNHFGHRQ